MLRPGEQITVATAKEIVAETKKKRPRRKESVPTEKLGVRLVKVLERYKERWNPDELSKLARGLWEFAEALETHQRAGKNKAKA
jgi:hypothetical protein